MGHTIALAEKPILEIYSAIDAVDIEFDDAQLDDVSAAAEIETDGVGTTQPLEMEQLTYAKRCRIWHQSSIDLSRQIRSILVC